MVHNECCTGPGYPTPLAAMSGPKEELIYVTCVQTQPNLTKKPDYLATIDVDPKSPTYSTVISRCYMRDIGDEIHHTGWNTCSSCHGDTKKKRSKLILPCLLSDKIYVVDVASDPRCPKLEKVIESDSLRELNCSTPHTSHCLANGDIMISTIGDRFGGGKGDFILLDSEKFEVKGVWAGEGNESKFGYDFWYQPYWNIMASSEWGAPSCIKNGLDINKVTDSREYGRSINLYSWKERKLIQTIDLGEEGIAPLEIRFLHDPKAAQGFVGCAVHSKVFRFFRKADGKWTAEKVIEVPTKKVTGWCFPEVEGMITDILISLDDRYLYFSNFLHGDVRQYDISDPSKPKLVGQLFLGGIIVDDGVVKVTHDVELKEQPKPVYIKGRRLYGSPQMLQLSLDGKRLYVTSSLFSPWDKQLHPDMVKVGGTMVKIDVDTEKGGLKLDESFLIDFGKEPDGSILAHEMRYPGGDCTSDIWLAND